MVAKLNKEAFKNAIADAKVRAKQGFNDFEMGQYTFKLDSYAIQQGSGDKGEMVYGKWICTSEEEKGKPFIKVFSVEKALSILLQEWRALGYDTDTMPETYDGLIAWCKMITKHAPEVLATIFMKKGYPTMRIDESVGEGEGAEAPAEEPAPAATTTKPSAPKSTPKAEVGAKPKTVAASAKPETVDDVEDAETVEEVEEVDQQAEVNVGTEIKFTYKGEEKQGVVENIDEAKGELKVLADNNGKKGRFTVKVDQITAVVK